VFSAPAALPLLVDLFEQQGALANLPAFVSGNAQRIYDLTPVRKQVTLVRQAWQVDDALDDAPAADKVTMFAGGETLAWQVQDVQVLV
jgi:dihydroorotase